MNFVRFCENRYQELTLVQQTQDAFSCWTDCEIKAIHALLSSYRVSLKWLLIPKVMADFALMKMGKRPEPKPVLINKAKADKKKREKEAAEKLSETNVTGVSEPSS